MNPQVDIRLELTEPYNLLDIGFVLELESGGWANLTIGFDNGDWPCTQRLTIELSSVWDPIPGLIELAESGAKLTFPHRIEIDSEGPESAISLLPIGAEGLALFEIRDLHGPMVYLAGLVSPRQFADSLGSAIADSLLDRNARAMWNQWMHHVGPKGISAATFYMENAWFREFITLRETEGEAESI